MTFMRLIIFFGQAYSKQIHTFIPLKVPDKNTEMFFNKVFGVPNKITYKLYSPILVTLLIFGYNFDFYNENVYIKILSRIYCVSLVVIVAYASTICCESQELSQIWSLLEYSLSVIIILCFKSHIKHFLEKLVDMDIYLRIRKTRYYRDLYKIIIIIFIVWIARLYYTYTYCLYYKCYNDFVLYLISALAPMGLDLNRVWRCALYDTIRYRLKTLRIRLRENPEDNFYLYIKNNKSIREDKIRFCLKLYRNIADLVELVSPEINASLFVSVACSLPKLIINSYYILTALEGFEPYEKLGFSVIHLTQISLLLFSPFVVVELFSVEVDRIRLLLIHILIDGVDSKTSEDIKLFLKYTSIRPFKYKLWRIIPINVVLPLELINLCTTYVIVIINFTHLYG